ncbi:DEDD exonuclease domain-containing protein [Kineosporia babensis]|uniref:DEDD exonuclease domain-containing protein n=1 Tax=Kineosporia babensis TaxID=499548 RepID=A0A9X1SUA9_9ACTN|nr:DEDD exonuclease domain-containing protein [Kineosporia babensis]MCD5311545.1 DEDD exonuclease domain-containing protein [Kineosporia babensis]
MSSTESSVATQEALWPEEVVVTGAGKNDAQALSEVTFVVFDLETTGGAPADAGITEFGAVKVRGGEVLGEFQTLVRPESPIPPFISILTGITDAMVSDSPSLGAVLPSFLEFCSGSVLVAHNAPYDVGFVKAACERFGHPWPSPTVIDTVKLARHIVSRDEAPNRKLHTLATLFGSPIEPDHRALHDARATVHVLHALLGRIGTLGVTTLGELRGFSAKVPESTRRKRHLADGMPTGPGVYLFRDERGEVLYVGTSVNIRTRVRNYFTAAEQRSRMREMVARAAKVTPIPCATTLEAKVREIRLIAEHAPPYNRRSKAPERKPWLKLTTEAFPRLSVVREVQADGATYTGPFTSQEQAEQAVAALHEAYPLRRCTPKLPRRPAKNASACILAEIGRCGAPCTGGIDIPAYSEVVEQVRAAMLSDAGPVVEASLRRATSLSELQRYEEAAQHRDRLLAYLRGAARAQRLAPIAAVSHLIGARRQERGGWEFALVRYGRLAGTSVSPPGADPMPYVEALSLTGEVVQPRDVPYPSAHPEETEIVLNWLEQAGTRLVEIEGTWAWPVKGAAQARFGLPKEIHRTIQLP